MASSDAKKMLSSIKKDNIEYVDLVYTDLRGRDHHMTICAKDVDNNFFSEGKCIDGSSIPGWKPIDKSDTLLLPDPSTAYINPFYHHRTMTVRCNVYEPTTMQPYTRCSRYVARKAEAYLVESGLADTCLMGPEPEFFIFDSVTWTTEGHHTSYRIDSVEGHWNSNVDYEDGNKGHRPGPKGGYLPLPPVDSSQDIRSAMCRTLNDLGISVEIHHHEVAPCQQEIGTTCSTPLDRADMNQNFKYVVKNVAHSYGKTATFMAKPLVGDNGNGMHVHISLGKKGVNIFAGDDYAGLSKTALHFIAGVVKHGPALCAFTNPTTNSYRRLVPGFEAPIVLTYSAHNRSAAIRIPHAPTDKAKRIEVRFPDATANSYLAFSALLMAGLDGVENELDPGAHMDEDLFELSRERVLELPHVCGSLDEALRALEADSAFLLKGDVFTADLLQAYIALKQQEVDRLNMSTHPVEFDEYFSD